MIKKIKKPKFSYKFEIHKEDYFFIENNLYYLFNKDADEKFYFNENGDIHRVDGRAVSISPFYFKYYLNNVDYTEDEFADRTDHLICIICEKFCKQDCFI